MAENNTFEPTDSRFSETWPWSIEELFDYLAEQQADEEFNK